MAQQNQMSPDALAGMLTRNRNELRESGQLDGLQAEAAASVAAALQAQGGGGRLGATLPRRLLKLVASVCLALVHAASTQVRRHPRISTLLGLLLAGALLAAHQAPRNGLVLSTGACPPLSRGHTTLLAPPAEYLEQYAVDAFARGDWQSSLPAPTSIASRTKTSKSGKAPRQQVGGVGMTRDLEAGADAAGAVDARRDVEGFALVATARRRVPLAGSDAEGDTADESSPELLEEEEIYLREAMAAVFQERKFSEFVPGVSTSLNFRAFLVASEEDNNDDEEFVEGAMLAMKSLGDFGRYGVQPLCLSYEIDDEEIDDEDGAEPSVRCVAFHTLKGGHFDGELRFSAEERAPTGTDAEEAGLDVSVTLAIPTGGRAPPAGLAAALASSLADSLARSAEMQRQQTRARRRQSGGYRAAAHGRAARKRQLRYEQGKAQEEMAAERKRKWKRNPDAARYRPTGVRAPPGGPKYSF